MNQINNKQKNNLNYKIVKCKNWEKDKTCKYGAHCTFAHGDTELRNKAYNLYQMGPANRGMMIPTFMMDMSNMMPMAGGVMQNQQFDMSQMPIQPMMMGMGMNNENQPNLQQIANSNEAKNE